ncbi:MAG TPA: hypothetical protein VJY62_17015 [Bacteroidia bacterium]|nr:hypothetical protein [Bacteroidia bacterium]
MNHRIKNAMKSIVMILLVTSAIVSCKKNKDAELPSISLKAGGNYTSGDATVSTSDLLIVGISADKNQDDLKTFKIYSSIGSGAFSLKKTFYLAPDEKGHYEKDYEFTPENDHTYETWKFEINDAAGNSNSVSIKLTIN